MSKAVTLDAIISSASTRADGSLSLRISTPELEPADKTVLFELLNRNLKLLIQPQGEEPAELHDIKSEFEERTPSQRLRAVLFVAWKQAGEPGEFENWYRKKMMFYIEDIKANLKPE